MPVRGVKDFHDAIPFPFLKTQKIIIEHPFSLDQGSVKLPGNESKINDFHMIKDKGISSLLRIHPDMDEGYRPLLLRCSQIQILTFKKKWYHAPVKKNQTPHMEIKIFNGKYKNR